MAFHVREARFRELVADAIDELPANLAREVANLAVDVHDWPSEEEQRHHRGLLLGLYRGVALTKRTPGSYNGASPDRITIFRMPHCYLARDETDLARRVRRTVLHEFGHYFGFSEAQLHELGWG
jgi:predicted Zn-dependent protease with MMP-like domain